MSGQQPRSVEVALALLDAFDRRDADGLVGLMAENVIDRPPPFLLGQQVLHGREAAKSSYLQLGIGVEREVSLRKRRYYIDRADDRKVLLVFYISVVAGRNVPFGSEGSVLLTLDEELREIAEIESWASEAEGLARLAEPDEIELPA